MLEHFLHTQYTIPRKPNNFTKNIIPKRVTLDDKNKAIL